MNQTKKTIKNNGLNRFIPILVIASGAGFFFAMGWHQYLSFEAIAANREALMGWAGANPVLAISAYMAAYTVIVALSLPGAVWMSLGGAFIFGTAVNSIAAVFAATVGATIIFIATRHAFADLARAKAGNMLIKLEKGFNKNAFSYLLFLRLVPAFPFWLVNIVPALLGVRLSTYVIATFFGIIPGTVVFSSVGAGLGHVFDAGETPDLGIIFEPQILIPIIALALLSLVPVIYNRVKQKGNKANG